jgi:hypothetical protein
MVYWFRPLQSVADDKNKNNFYDKIWAEEKEGSNIYANTITDL